MNDWTASQIKEFISVEIKAERRLRNALREGDNKRLDASINALERKFESSVSDVDKATKLLFMQNSEHFEKLNNAHEEAQRILATYALLRDFNEFKSKTDLTLADIASRLKNLEEHGAAHEQRLKNIEEVAPSIATRFKDLETSAASREERLRIIEATEIGRYSLSKDEKERQMRVIQRFQILSVISALVGVVVGILVYIK